MKIRNPAVSCLCFFLFVPYSYAFQANDRVQLVERDFGIPAHPAPGYLLRRTLNDGLGEDR